MKIEHDRSLVSNEPKRAKTYSVLLYVLESLLKGERALVR